MDAPLSNILPIIISFLFIGGIITLIVYLNNRQMEKLHNNFRRLADEFRLNYIEPEKKWWKRDYPVVDGMLLDRHVRIGMRVVGSGKHRQEYTYISMDCTSKGYTMSLTQEGFLGKVGKFFGGQDIQIGDQAFDAAFIIKGNNERIIKNLLDASTKRMLVENRSNLIGKLEVRHNKVYYEAVYQMYYEKNYRVIRQIIKVMETFAKRTDEVQHYI